MDTILSFFRWIANIPIWDNSWNVIGNVGGALVGGLIAYHIALKQSKNDKEATIESLFIQTEITDLNNLNAMLQEVMSYFYTQQKNIDLVNEQDGIQKPLFMVDLIQKQGDLPIVKQVDAIVALANNLEIGDNLKEVGKKINQFSDAYEDLTLILMDAPNVQNSEDYVSVDKSKFDEGVNLIKQKAMEVNAELSNLNVVVSNRQKVIKSKYYSK